MISTDPKGNHHFFQAVIQFYVHRLPDLQKQAPALCLELYNNSVISDQFFTSWYEKKMKLDRDTVLSDVKAERVMRGLLTEFIEFLKSAEYGDEGKCSSLLLIQILTFFFYD